MGDTEEREWVKLSEKKPYAGFLLLVGAGLFMANFFEVDEPYNKTLATLTFAMAAAGLWWLWHLKKRQDLLVQRTLERHRASQVTDPSRNPGDSEQRDGSRTLQ